jgi:hypothetical protein
MKDFKLTVTGDLLILNGDLVIGTSDEQQVETALLTQAGELKQYPEAGIGIENFVDDDLPGDMLQKIRTQLEKDGMTVSGLSFIDETGNLNINAKY